MLFAILPYVLQLLLIYHAIRNGKPWTWILLLVILPGIGGLLYFFMEILPELRNRSGITKERVAGLLDREAGLKRIRDKIALSNTTANQLELADELLRLGRFDEAADQYRSQLQGLYADDRGIRLRLAEALVRGEHYPEAAEVLEALNDEEAFRSTRELFWLYLSRYQANNSLAKPYQAPAELEQLFDRSGNYEVAFHLGVIYRAAGRKAELKDLVARAELLDRNDRSTIRAEERRFLRDLKLLA